MTALDSQAPPPADAAHTQGQRPTMIWSDVDCGAALRLALGLLGDQGGGEPVREVARPADAGPELAASPEARLLLLRRSPVAAMSAAMSGTTPPSTALKVWTRKTQEILRLVRRHRRQVIVVDAGMAVSHPDAFARQLGLAGAAGVPGTAEAGADPILGLLACEALSHDSTARVLAGELEASSVELARIGPGPRIDADAVFSRYQIWLRENDLLQRRMDQMQAQLASEQLRAQKLEGDLSETTARLRTMASEMQSASGKLKAALASNEKIRASLSYRMTAPLRWIRSAMKRKKRGQNNG